MHICSGENQRICLTRKFMQTTPHTMFSKKSNNIIPFRIEAKAKNP